MILVKNAYVYSPKNLGKCDVLTGGGKILSVEGTINHKVLPFDIEVIDASDMFLVPGFIDGHQHFTGGGGEGGFHTRTPEMQLSMNIKNGVTTAVGLLGTDSLTRSVESLYAKTQAFNAEGMTAYMLTGSYWLPSPTICGSVGRDLVYLDPVIGVKLALADQRGPNITREELAKLASDVRVSALVSNKPGFITVHTGINPQGMDLIFEVIEKDAIRADIFVPTHVNKKDSKIWDQALEIAEKGAFIDATCLNSLPGEKSHNDLAGNFLISADDNNLFEKVCFSSDAGGSLPIWNEDKSRILGMGIGTPSSLLFELKQLVNERGMKLDKALKPLTTTPAEVYGLKGKKGSITTGSDADLIVLDPNTFEIRDVLAKGEIMMKDGKIERKGYFE